MAPIAMHVVTTVASFACVHAMQVVIDAQRKAGKAECKDFCEKIPKEWEEKCGIPPCSGCDACSTIEIPAPCLPFCANVPADRMCSIEPCTGCDECAATDAPTAAPTAHPTPAPTAPPSPAPTPSPTAAPTPSPTAAPTPSPTSAPTPSPTPLEGKAEPYEDCEDGSTDAGLVCADDLTCQSGECRGTATKGDKCRDKTFNGNGHTYKAEYTCKSGLKCKGYDYKNTWGKCK